MVSGTSPFCQQFRGLFEYAAAAGVVLEQREQFDANEGNFRVDAFPVDDVPDFGGFGKGEGTGKKAVFTGVRLSFCPPRFFFTI